MFGRLAMGFANVRAGTRVLMLVLVQAAMAPNADGTLLLIEAKLVEGGWAGSDDSLQPEPVRASLALLKKCDEARGRH